MDVIEFLRQVKALLGKFGVRDEGEYWVTANEETLRYHFDTINKIIHEYVEKDPGVRVGVHEPNGRITDLIK